MKNLSLILFYLVLVSNSIFHLIEAKYHRIVGGDSASIDQFKYQVSIQTHGKHICGGGIIGERFVLTSAHCVINYKNDFVTAEFIVLAATVDYKAHTTHTVTRMVEKVYVPKEYHDFNPNPQVKFFRKSADIAVLKLTEDFGLENNHHLSKLNLPAKANSYSQYLNEKAIIAGFGINKVTGTTVIPLDVEKKITKTIIVGESYHKLKFATAKVVDNKVCSNSYMQPLYRSHLCAQIVQRDPNHPEGICSGDSGSPLVINGNTVIGVVASSSYTCEEDRYPTEYTRVTSFIPFIENAMKDEKSYDTRVASYQLQKKYFGKFGTMRVLVEEKH